jgi:SAM-dependent methyltransferase
MHPVNRILSPFGLQITRAKKLAFPKDKKVRKIFWGQLAELKKSSRGFSVEPSYVFEGGGHPHGDIDWQCGFTVRNIRRFRPAQILDIGSYRHFVIGLLANIQVTTVDIRGRKPAASNEKVIVCDAKALNIPDTSYDAVTSLCSIEHFGLGRYGDEFDPDGDLKAFSEMIRVLKPGGRVIFSVPLRKSQPKIVFNEHREYSYQMIRTMCDGLICEDEAVFDASAGREYPLAELANVPQDRLLYAACWRKPG